MKEIAIDYTMLEIPSFDMLHIEKFRMEQKINDHIILTFSGIIPEEMGEEQLVMYTNVGYQVEVYYHNGDKKSDKKKLFQGIVVEVKVQNIGKIKYLCVTAYSNTFQMDVIKNSCSFQDTASTYKQVLNEVVKRTNKSKAMISSEFNKTIGKLVVQYLETDWEFIKRMASQFHIGLVADSLSEKPQVWIGYSFVSAPVKIHVLEYTASKNIRKYQLELKNGITDAKEANYLVYEIKSYDILKVMDTVEFHKQTYYIKNAVYEMKKGILIGRYIICKKENFKLRKISNWELSGISLNGLVSSVERDKVKVKLDIDSKSNASYLFPYSTISASPDGSGWYCMPRKGDQVRIYFPDQDESNAFAISSVSSYVPQTQGGKDSDRMSDPNIRYLRTPDGMEIKLDPNGITINAADGQGIITLDNKGNIGINAMNELSISATNDINIIAENNICLFATEDISIKGSQGDITLQKDGNTVITGQFVAEN